MTSSQDILTSTQQPSRATTLPVTQLQTVTINVTDLDSDQSQPNQISAASSTLDLSQFGTAAITDPTRHLSAPGPSNQYQQQVLFSAAAVRNPDTFHQPISQTQPAINTQYGLAAPFVSQQAAMSGEIWHSGHSPYRTELVELPSKVKNVTAVAWNFLKSSDNLRLILL